MGLLQATATNIIGMVGVGPFLTIPFMVSAMGGPHILYAWAFGALLAFCDGLVYAELGAALPGSGGLYHFLREVPAVWSRRRPRVPLHLPDDAVAPLTLTSGGVGFANPSGFH
jgi:hypothetical protein